MLDSYEEIIKYYGEPILKFTPENTKEDKTFFGIPSEVIVVNIDHISSVMVFSTYDGVKWYCNDGERWVIRYLLGLCNGINI